LSNLKLKRLENLLSENIDYPKLIKELGFKKGLFDFRGRKMKEKFLIFAKQIQAINIHEVRVNPECKIDIPDFDDISFIAMLELQALDKDNISVIDCIASFISILCFKTYSKRPFDIDSIAYKSFKKIVLNQPALDMIGLYNALDKELKDYMEHWDKLFEKQYIYDPDWIEAGGEKMGVFNTLTTIKSVCKDFNIPYPEAWQLGYGIVQTNALSKATQDKIQHTMMNIKEKKMRAKRGE